MNDRWVHINHTPDGVCSCGGQGQFTFNRDGLTLSLCTPCALAGFDRIADRARMNLDSAPER